MTDTPPAFPSLEHCVERIDAAYKLLGHTLGWRFLTGPQRTFRGGTEFGFITLNPGGTRDDPDHPQSSSETGSAYWVESWEGSPPGSAPLQRQIQELFGRIASVVGASESARGFVETRVLMAHFVPFRSPRLHELHRRKESIAWARELWAEILAAWTPRTIMTIDRDTFKHLHGIISGGPAQRVEERQFPTGWGAYTAQAARFRMPDGTIGTLARLPHLSSFKLMSREACRQPVQDILDYVYAPVPQEPLLTGSPRSSTQTDGVTPRGGALSEQLRSRRQPASQTESPRTRAAGDTPQQLAGVDGAALYPEWEAHISDSETRAALRLLVKLAASSPRLDLSFRLKGALKTCRLHDPTTNRNPYSFIVNKGSLKFYFRLPEWRSRKSRLRREFDSFDDSNSNGEWTVRLRSENDVRRLLVHVGELCHDDGRQPAGR